MIGGELSRDESICVLRFGGFEVIGQVKVIVVLLIFFTVLLPILSECEALSLDKGE